VGSAAALSKAKLVIPAAGSSAAEALRKDRRFNGFSSSIEIVWMGVGDSIPVERGLKAQDEVRRQADRT
jgi:hypothetical protein